MHDGIRWRTFVAFLPALALIGCDLPDPCQRCEEPEATQATEPIQTPTTSTVKLEVDWAKLSEALSKVQTGGSNQTISVESLESLEMTVPPGSNPSPPNPPPPVWNKLIAALNAVAKASGGTHNIRHTTLNLRFAPPWVKAGSDSVVTTYVVFAEEAKIDLLEKLDKDCVELTESQAASVCPDHAFHEMVLGQFLQGLAQCATGEDAVLHVSGFASSSRVESLGERQEQMLDETYGAHIMDVAGKCKGTPPGGAPESQPDDSGKFNLLVANLRAAHTEAMLNKLAARSKLDGIRIERQDWCSHGSMAPLYPDTGPNGYSTAKGLVNRRAEIRLAALPGCASG